jgi:putative secretion ATPase (PEP-CTERM system associated)
MYQQFYGLSGKPFQLSPDARFFFDSRAHHRAMAYLRYGLNQREGFIVITGGIGTGKTMLARNLFAELPHDELVAAHLVSTQVEADDILRLINAAFGLQHEHLTKAALLRNLETFFRARQAEGKRVLIVVDEAQNLPPRTIEELRMLSNYQDEEGRALVQSFLLGQTELKDTLQRPEMEQVRQRIIAAHHLDPLDVAELRAYVEHRLGCVGWQGKPSIDEEVYQVLHQATGGVPRRVNTLGDRLMLFAAIEELDHIDSSHAEEVVADVMSELGGRTGSEPVLLMDTDAVGLEERVVQLEGAVQKLAQRQRKHALLLKKLLLLQMESEGDDAI